jgi:hypothetical protein
MTITNKYKSISCKICDGHTSILGLCDYNKNCENNTVQMPNTGKSIYYHQCNSCQFIFTVDFDEWTKDDFIKNIYNDDYLIVDPKYDTIRPTELVKWILPYLNEDKSITLLDYGAGNSVFGTELSKLGWDCKSWDPLWKTDPTFDKDTKFDVVTSFEVLEHTPTPYETAKEMLDFLDPESGQLIVQTLTNDIIKDEGIDYWYIAPRNGHVCMHSYKSLDVMFDRLGMEVYHEWYSVHFVSWKD